MKCNLTATILAQELLSSVGESRVLLVMRKQHAIHKIKCQPFFSGGILPKSEPGFVKLRRPTKHLKMLDKD